MVKRKLITTLLAPPLSLAFIFAVFFGEWKQPLELIVMTGMFSLILSPYILFYGIPVTFLSDYVSKNLTGNIRAFFALIVHLFFGVMFSFIFPSNASSPLFRGGVDSAIIFGSITALFFWTIDEILRRSLKQH
ncbi:hypothetical protein ACFSO7_23705 [Bacillus sp. CGMCC 1.16607]|uniref:hypothetical protein n=1 Tax=Bacillus sp. CGMCC 1.16607 TaxID=3351842 RepID=UPI003626C77E